MNNTHVRKPRRLVPLLVIALLASLGLVATAPPALASPVQFCDVNNDGFDDLPVGSPNETHQGRSRSGMFHMLLGTADDGLVPQATFLFGGSVGNELGTSLLCIDVNRDGFDDIIIGQPFSQDSASTPDSGSIVYIPGSATGLDFSQRRAMSQETPGIKGKAEAFGGFGFALTWGFLDSDQYVDIVVSAPGATVGGADQAGKVYILYGGANGPTTRDTVIHQNKRGIKGKAQEGDFFGESLASQDFDGDGFHDLAVGVPSEDVSGEIDAGAINVIFGNGNGLSRRDQLIHQDRKNVPGAAEEGDRFGATLLTVDKILSNSTNRRWDLLVGVPSEDLGSVSNAGLVVLLEGTVRGLRGTNGQVLHRNVRGVKGKARENDFFGASLASGFFGPDASLDLAVGVPGDDRSVRNAGSIHIFPGTSGGFSATGDRIVDQDTARLPGRSQAGDRLGLTMALGDFNGDGMHDLALGIPEEDVDRVENAGAFMVIDGSSDNLEQGNAELYVQELSTYGTSPEPYDNFGMFSTPAGCCGLTPQGSPSGAGHRVPDADEVVVEGRAGG